MSTNVVIRQEKKLFKKLIDLSKIYELWQNSCVNVSGNKCIPQIGTQDNFGRLDKLDVNSNNFCLYDKNNYIRGIVLYFDQNNICLIQNQPSTLSEINSFYNLIRNICNQVGTNTFYIDNTGEYNLANIKDINYYIEGDLNCSYKILKDMYDNSKDKEKGAYLFCISNPIYLSINDIETFEILKYNDLTNLEKYLNQKQCVDRFYAVPNCFQQNDSSVDVTYALPTDCETTIPLDPEESFNMFKSTNPSFSMFENIDNFYVVVEHNNKRYKINYNNFIESINKESYNYYDCRHIIVNYKKEMIKNLVEKLGKEI